MKQTQGIICKTKPALIYFCLTWLMNEGLYNY